MTTIAATVTNVRRLLQDNPDRDYLAAAIAAAGTTTMTVTDVTKYANGNVWELDDGSGDQVRVRSVDTSTSIVTIERGFNGSTAAAHSNGAALIKNPRFTYDEIAQAINQTLDVDLFSRRIYDMQEHQITSSATTSAYNAPTTSCEEFLDVYQRVNANDTPATTGLRWTQYPRNADTTLWANGKVFEIHGNYGTGGTALYYVTCAHKLAIGTLTASQERIVQNRAAQYVLQWTAFRRIQGPTNQGDRSVRPGDELRAAAFFGAEFERLCREERAYLKDQIPPFRVFRKGFQVRTSEVRV